MGKIQFKARLSVFLLLLGAYAHAQPLNGSYSINSGQPTGPTNFQTFTEATFALISQGVNGPVDFHVVPGSGPYNEQIVITTVNGTSATNRVTFHCNGVVLTFLSSNSFNRAGVKIDSADYITFDSLVVEPQGTGDFEYSYGFHLLRDADHNVIQKCTVTIPYNGNFPQNNEGIVINGYDELATWQASSGCDSNTIINNTITGGYSGITLASIPVFGDPIRYMNGNKVIGNRISNMIHVGIYLFYGNNTLIEGNDIQGGPRSVSCAGIRIYESNQSTIVRNNRIHNFVVDPSEPFSDLKGIQIAAVSEPGKENLIYNNLIYDFQSPGEQEGISAFYQASYLNIYHNTISLDDVAVPSSSHTHGLHLDGSSENILFQNNIVTISRAGTGERYGIYLENPNPPGFRSNRNDIYITGPGSPAAFGRMDGNTYTTLSDWQTGAGYDYGSASLDPQYTSLATGNLIPNNQAIDNMGLYMSVNTDIDGAPRNNNHPDIGAHEFLTPPCTDPVWSGDAVVQPATTVCANATVSLNLSGNTFGTGQTYQWQTSSTLNGTYTDMGAALAYPAHDINPVATLYYRAVVTCGATQVISDTVLVTVNPALPAGTYTINSGAATGGTNFNSFTDAVAAMHCGIAGPVVFNVVQGSGPYNEQVILHNIAGVSSTSTITFNGNGETLQYLSTNNDERAVFKIDGTDYVTIDSLRVVATGAASGEYGFGIQLINDVDFCTIRRCTVEITTASSAERFAGIVMSPGHDNAIGPGDASECDNNLIEGNTIIGGHFGITSYSWPSDGLTKKNRFLNNTIRDIYSYGIYITGTDSAIVEGNDISRPTRTSVTTFYGIYINRQSNSLQVSKNRIHNQLDGNLTSTSASHGIYFNSCDAPDGSPNIVSNNLIYNFKGEGQQTGLYNNGSNNALYYHNTISLDDSTVTNANFARAIYQTGSATGLEYKNNLVTIRRRGTNTHYGIYMNSASTVFTASNNNYYVASTTATNYTGRYNGVSYSTVPDWQTGSGQDANSLSVNPEYTDPANGNFSPFTAGLDNKGVFADITTDILNAARSATTPDIGAYEFSYCTTFPVAVLASDSIAVCTGNNATFDIENPQAGDTYTWYDASAGGTVVHTGTSYTVNNVTAPVEYWVEARTAAGCVSTSRTRAKAIALAPLAQAPVATVDSVSASMVRFEWDAVPGATGYSVSTDGTNFVTPSSGPTGLTHTISGLDPRDTITITVRALGLIDCQNATSLPVGARTLSDEFFVPNMFSPNGDGRNDVFYVYGNTIQSIKLSIFNQWGEKIFETTNRNDGWNGSYKGRQQPVGVYVYVVSLTTTNGTTQTKKGILNLLR